jgi:hypothetical protein
MTTNLRRQLSLASLACALSLTAAACSDVTAACADPSTVCNGVCVNPASDSLNCGACGNVCSDGEICVAGACTLNCPANFVLCGDACVDPNNDRNFCGATGDCSGANAGTQCQPGEICDGAGSCALTCQEGLVDCGGLCTDPKTSRTHCGAGPDCTAARGTVCDPKQLCNAGVCEPSCFNGTLGTSWEELADPLDSLFSMMSYSPASIPGIYNMYPAMGQVYDPIADGWTPLVTAGPGALTWFSMAPVDGDLYGVRTGQIHKYRPWTQEWEVLNTYTGTDDLNMTESDEFGHVFGHTQEGDIIDYDVGSDTVTQYPTGLGGMFETRMGYDPGTRALYFGAYNEPDLHKFDLMTLEASTLTPIPESQLNDIFCSDRCGHIYAAGDLTGTTMFQYDVATDTWSPIPDLPTDHGNNWTCTVSEEGYLYVGTDGPKLYRIPLER